MHEQELQRIREEYQHRDTSATLATRYQPDQPATRLYIETLRQELCKTLARSGVTDFADRRILDVGCGAGGWLARLQTLGARAENLFGIDLLPWRIEMARSAHPDFHFSTGSAHQLPYADASFDLVICFVLFSSVLDEALQRTIAAEMWRVLANGGSVIVYDFMYNNPRNPAVRGMPLKRVRALFPEGTHFDTRRITLAPLLARLLAPRSYWLARSLERCKVFDTHLLLAIRKGVVSHSE